MDKLSFDITGNEFDWFAVDKNNYVGHFSTAGFGFAPKTVIAEQQEYREVLKYLLLEQGTSEVKLATVEMGNYSEWIQVAGHGIFSYDYIHWTNTYKLIAIPIRPILVFTLPEEIQKTVRRIQIGVDGFANASVVDFDLVSIEERV